MSSPPPKSTSAAALRCVGIASILWLGCGENDGRPAQWSFIAPVILAPTCATASCHSKAAAASGLDFSEPATGYRSLLRQRSQFFLPVAPATSDEVCSAERGGTVCLTARPLVQPCNPDQSRLISMLRGRGAQRMPPDRPLPIGDIELIERWILAGAKQYPADPLPTCGSLDAGTADGRDAGAPEGPDVQTPDAQAPLDGAAG